MLDENKQALFALVRAGLWEKEVRLALSEDIDYDSLLELASEQSVVGLVSAGLEHIVGAKVPKECALQFVGQTLQIEQQNRAMNVFLAELIEKLRQVDIYTLLVKGQGIAQCYDRPLWRACGDIDLYLSKDNYKRAMDFLSPQAQYIEKEDKKRFHLGMTLDGWVVELHGTMYTKLSKRMNRVSDEVHNDLFFSGNVRSCYINDVQVFLPSPDNDAIIIFNHFINHLFMEGVGLRQICDWCRLLWTYKDSLNHGLLESRIGKMRLMSEWKSFGAFAVDYLGMPADAMPFYCSDLKWKRKAKKICKYVLESGNFGHNRDLSYRANNPAAVVNTVTFWRRLCDFAKFSLIFPCDSPKFFCHYLLNRITKY